MSTLTVSGHRLTTGLGTAVVAGRRGLAVFSTFALPALVAFFMVALVNDTTTARPLEPADGLVALGLGIALYWRRSHPRTVAAITVVGSLMVLLAAPLSLLPYAGLVALWTLTVLQPPRVSLPALAALLAVTSTTLSTNPAGDGAFALAVVVAVWALAEATRSRRAAIVQASQQAAEREQARIARELHDVIAHSVSVIVVQAAAGDDVFEHNPAAAREALRSIESTGREALVELRRLLACARAAEPGEQHHPQPGLDRLAELVEPLRAAGLPVQLQRVDDESVVVPAGVQLSAYRIVQEALTNAVRHARATGIEIRIEATEHLLSLTVANDGARNSLSSQTIAGRGITGMRERVDLHGGQLEAGHRPGGGFRVHARLPLRSAR
jgi:signal transduction histidine kinase